VVVAVTGAIMLGFLVGHVVGNLKVFLPDPAPGVADIDAYAEFLRSFGEPIFPRGGALWTARLTLLSALAIHTFLVVKLSLRSKRARPVGYANQRHARATRPARWMMATGVLLLVFIVFHLLHFTTGTVDPASFETGAVYANLRRAFASRWFVTLYVVAMGVVVLHLYHGVWSMFQTLGIDNPDRNRALRWLAVVLSVALFVGFVTVPISFATGLLDQRAETVGAAVVGVREPAQPQE
jgi:succinate dehydrogenase / fumarate reductase cytochrome b subunit